MRKASRSLACAVAIASLGMAAQVPADTVVSPVPLKQQWVKRGLILEPGFAGPSSSKFVSSPSVIRLEDGRLRMYVWVADGTPPWLHGHHIIIAAESERANPFRWHVISKEALVGPDPTSRIRDRGVGFPYVLPRSDGPWLMYYSTWGGDWTRKQELTNRIGVAASHDAGRTWAVVKEDVLPSGPRGSFDAGAIPSVAVLRTGQDAYQMWYTAAEKYLRFGNVNQGIMHIGAARSRDGIQWNKLDGPALQAREGAADPYEACLARPGVLKIDGVYHMWFGVYDMAPGSRPNATNPADGAPSSAGVNRTGAGSYRIEYARSTDGVRWTRFPDQPIFPLTPGGFDSVSQTYVSVVDMGEQLWLFYTGDGLGNTGVGLATLDKHQLRDQ
jgi:hypothetical protein